MSPRVRLPAPLREELAALVRLVGPVILSQLASSAVGLISTAVIGRLGAPALAAAAYANALYGLFFAVLLGVMSSVGPRAAQAYGAGDAPGIARALRGGLWLALGLTVLTVPLLVGVALLLPRFVPPGIRADLAAAYLGLSALGLLPALASVALRGTLEGLGRPQVVTRVMLGGVTLVAVFSPALAFGWGPLPALGVVGAGVANAITTWGTALALLHLALQHAPHSVSRLRAEVGALWRLGWPIGLALGAEGGTFSVISLLMARFGSEALAAHNLALQVVSTVFMVPLGVAVATGIRVAHAAGSGDWKGVRQAGLLGITVAAGVMVVFALLEASAPRLVLGLLTDVTNPQNVALVNTAAALLTIAALLQTLDGVIITTNVALRNLQDTSWPLLISLTSYWLIGLGSGILLAFVLHLGPRGLWWGLTVGLATAAVLLVARFLRKTGQQLPSHPLTRPPGPA